jgi:hypothetical protein
MQGFCDEIDPNIRVSNVRPERSPRTRVLQYVDLLRVSYRTKVLDRRLKFECSFRPPFLKGANTKHETAKQKA